MNGSALTVDLVGSGNVAFHLAQRFSKVGVLLRSVYARDLSKIKTFPSGCAPLPFDDLHAHDATVPLIIAVSDDAIPAVAGKIPKNCTVLHTSGSVPLDALPQSKRGVLYPLQSFSHAQEIDWTDLPLIIEASEDETGTHVDQLANQLSNRVVTLTSQQRLHLHLAAVIVNNFVNHLFGLSAGYLESKQLPFDLLQPLIRQTAEKIVNMTPVAAQTGPAKRNDQTTIKRHLDMLENHPDARAVYELLSQQIIRLHHER